MRFKDFEIRKINDDKYEVVKWTDNYCFTIAFIDWDKHEDSWEFDGVGMRFINYYENGLCDYIKKYMDLIDVVRNHSFEYEDVN
jgi:hypothetical protein